MLTVKVVCQEKRKQIQCFGNRVTTCPSYLVVMMQHVQFLSVLCVAKA